jgi:hypothetical protein
VPPKERLGADHERRPPAPGKDLAQRGHEQPIAAAKARPAKLALEDLQLVTKDHDLDFGLQQLIGRASDPLDQAAQQQIHEREEHERNLHE